MENHSIIETIEEFVELDWDGVTERRSEGRKPFYRPATVLCGSGEEYAAFTRDISRGGLRLFHRSPIPRGAVEIQIQLDTAKYIRVAADIVWCGRSGSHFASGARLREELQT